MKTLDQLPKDVKVSLYLAKQIHKAALSLFGQKDIISKAHFGTVAKDYQHKIDDAAEAIILKKGLTNTDGLFTEDKGLILPNNVYEGKTLVRYIDPVEGTRAAITGAEQCLISIANVPYKKDARLDDVTSGVVMTLKEGQTYFVIRGQGVFEILANKKLKRLHHLSPHSTHLSDLSVTFENYGVSFAALSALDPLRSHIYADQLFPSGGYALLMLARGQTHFHVDIRKKLLETLPRKYFFKEKYVGPLDIAVTSLMVRELGGVVTDSDGNSIGNSLLWRYDRKLKKVVEGSKLSVAASASPQIHKKVLPLIHQGIKDAVNKL